MAEYCRNCGTELLAGQRFCRMCGAQVGDAQREELPTKVFPGERPSAGGGAATAGPTASQSKPGTDPFSPFQQPTAPQWPAPQQQTTPLYMPPDQVSSKGRAMMFLVIGLVGVALLSMFLLVRNYRQAAQVKTAPPPPPSAETEIPAPPEPPPVADDDTGGTLDESGAVEKDNETVITKSYALDADATFSIKGVNANVEIDGWDESKAEVKIIKRGGSIEECRGVRVSSSYNDDRLSFQTSPTGNGDVEVRYQVKLPRGLRRVEINNMNVEARIVDMTGAIEIKAQNASVELSNNSGATAVNLVNGSIEADYDGVELKGPQQLKTVNGKVEVTLDDDTNADVQASTISGSIDLDDDFSFKVEKKFVGQKASGRVGDGGQSISVSTVNGPIKISK
ncbi:MAG: DUF4097 family beta strand repeat-containing protein [Pyrinomonadaceae bacterium]